MANKVPRFREYSTCFGGGTVHVRIFIPPEYTKVDVDDLLDWFELINRQIKRLAANLKSAQEPKDG